MKWTRWSVLLFIAVQPWFFVYLFGHQLDKKVGVLNRTVGVAGMVGVDKMQRNEEWFKFFERTLRPYTNLRVVPPTMAWKRYLNTSGLSREEVKGMHAFLEEYLSFHSANRDNRSRLLVFRPVQVGAGDLMERMLHAYWLAVMSRRVFLVDWRHPFRLQTLLENGRIGVQMFYNESKDGGDDMRTVRYLNGTMLDSEWDEKILLSSTRMVIAQKNRMAKTVSQRFADGIQKRSGVSLQLALTMRVNLNLQRAILHHAFRLSADVRREHARVAREMNLRVPYGEWEAEEGRSWWVRWWARWKEKQTDRGGGRSGGGGRRRGRMYIGVHARLGKGVGEGRERFTEISAEMQKAAKCLAMRGVQLALMGTKDPLPIFLATDTKEFRELFRRAVKDMGRGRVEVESGEWTVVHMNRMGSVADAQAKHEALMGGLMDLAMLGHAQHVVSLYSSFPRLALRLGDCASLTELRNDICLHEW